MKPEKIRVIAICLFRRGDRILVFEGFDAVAGTHFYRPLGGGVHPGETSREAVIREIREEVGLEVADLTLLGSIENIFVLNGRPRHEIVYVYDGRFVDESVYAREELEVIEDDGERLRARWLEIGSFGETRRLVPETLRRLLGASTD